MVQQVFDSIAVKELQGNVEISLDAGAKPTIASGTGLVIRNNSAASDGANLSLITGGSGSSKLNFGTSSDEDRGNISYNQANDRIGIITATSINFWQMKFRQLE